MASVGFHWAYRRGHEAVARYARLSAGDVGLPVEPAKVPGATPGAKDDALLNLTVSIDGEFNGARHDVAFLTGSNDGGDTWTEVRDTGGNKVTGLSGAQHVDGTKFKLYRPQVDQFAGSVAVNVAIHFAHRA